MDQKVNREATPWWVPDARGWIGVGVFAVTVLLLRMMREAALREDEFFQTIATMVISSGFLSVVAWAYAATKGGGELADKNAAIVAESATATVATGVANREEPTQVEVVNTDASPVPTTNGTTVPEELPEYAKP